MTNSSSFCYALQEQELWSNWSATSLILQPLRSTNNLVSVNIKVKIKTAMAKFLWVTIPNFQILSTFSIINCHLIRSMQVQVLMYCLKTTKFTMRKAKCNCPFILLWWYLNLNHVIACWLSNHTPWQHNAQWLVTCTLCNHVQLLEGSASVRLNSSHSLPLPPSPSLSLPLPLPLLLYFPLLPPLPLLTMQITGCTIHRGPLQPWANILPCFWAHGSRFGSVH